MVPPSYRVPELPAHGRLGVEPPRGNAVLLHAVLRRVAAGAAALPLGWWPQGTAAVVRHGRGRLAVWLQGLGGRLLEVQVAPRAGVGGASGWWVLVCAINTQDDIAQQRTRWVANLACAAACHALAEVVAREPAR